MASSYIGRFKRGDLVRFCYDPTNVYKGEIGIVCYRANAMQMAEKRLAVGCDWYYILFPSHLAYFMDVWLELVEEGNEP